MKRFLQLTSLLIFLSGIQSCQKTVDYFEPLQNGPDTTWQLQPSPESSGSTLRNIIRPERRRDTFTLATTNNITLQSGIRLEFNIAALVTAAGTPITGPVAFESILLKSKGDMLRAGIPTTSNGSMLISGGAFFVQAFRENQPLQIPPNNGIAFHFNTTSVQPGMKLFNGIGIPGPEFNWLPSQDTSYNRIIPLQNAYTVLSTRLGWINCDKFYNTGIAVVNVAAGLPSNYTNVNSAAFVVFNNQFTIVGMRPDINQRKFVAQGIPAGERITLVVISKQGDDYYLGHEQTTTASSSLPLETVPVHPVKVSLDQMIAYLNSL